MTEVATIEEWRAFLRSDGFYTAPEFLAQKFWLKTGKLPPHGSGISHFTPADTLGDDEE
tara:strand:- start:10280 stop:10456 length:177 start_codon:yes stop_codon:yes gene_type:complete